MLNKKAIAAFAAGATLLSGLAFAAPAFAKDEAPKADQKTEQKAEECTPATASELFADQKAIDEALDGVHDAQKALATAKQELKVAQANHNTLQRALDKLVADFATKKAAADNAKKAYDDALAKYVTDPKTTTKTEDAFKATDDGKKLAKDLKDANDAYYGNGKTSTDEITADKSGSPAQKVKFADDAVKNDEKTALAEAQQKVADAKKDVENAKADLKAAKEDLAKDQCKGEKPAPKPNPVKPNPADPTPVTPGPVTPSALPTVAQASGALMHTNVAYNEAAADYTTSVSELKDAQAKYDEAKAQLNTLKAQVKAANDNYQNNFVLAGKADTDAGKAAKADLDNAVNLRDAYKTHEFKAASDKLAEKKAKLDQAGKKLNAAKVQYSAAYLTALRVEASAVKGFPDPRNLADAPVDVFSPEGKAAAGKLAAAAAQAGKAGAAANGAAAAAGANGAKAAAGENGGKKKNNAGEDAKKKLGQTGATVALAAVAASVLAGVGAALRKIRH